MSRCFLIVIRGTEPIWKWMKWIVLLIGKRKREVKIGKHNYCYNKTIKTVLSFII